MAKFDLKTYKKLKPSSDDSLVNSSVMITKKQKEWIAKEDLNFSVLVRDFLNELMTQKKEVKK